MPRTSKRPVREPSAAVLWARWTVGVGVVVGLIGGLLAFARYQSPEARWHRQHEAQRAERLGERGPELVDWRPIHGQLVQYSRRSYPVIVGQTGQWGQANPAGHILLDLTTLREPRDILAFKLAHEWAHLALGHGSPHQEAETPGTSTSPKPPGAENVGTVPSPLRSAWDSPTFSEDEADLWAGAFLAHYGYDLEAVAAYLRKQPYDPNDHTHSPGSRRAELVLKGLDRGAKRAEP